VGINNCIGWMFNLLQPLAEKQEGGTAFLPLIKMCKTKHLNIITHTNIIGDIK